MPKLSILVPVYNTEKFLKLCLDSILNQSFKDYEIIVVDDGSTDSSLKILKDYTKKEKRLKVFHRKNKGYGATLNFALEKAKGEYIGIVESDDFVDHDMFKKLVKLAEKNNAEIVKCSFFNYFGKTGETNPERVFHECNIKNSELINPFFEQSIFLVDPSIWSCIYLRDMLVKKDIKFLETPGASFQDTGFQFKTFATSKSIYCLEEPLYYYRRDNEKSSSFSLEKVNNVKLEFDSIDEFSKLSEISAACRFRSYIWNLNRLKINNALIFSKIMKEDYKRLKKSSAFRANFYVRHHLQRAYECTFAIRHPKAYVYLRPVFRLYNCLKHKIYVIIKMK